MPKKKKSKPLKWYKKRLDKLISDYVRKQSDRCYTCDRYLPYELRQCGHFISRRNYSTRYELSNLRVQGACCNIFRYGNIPEFAARLLKEIGIKEFNELIARGRTTKQWSIPELEEEIKRYET